MDGSVPNKGRDPVGTLNTGSRSAGMPIVVVITAASASLRGALAQPFAGEGAGLRRAGDVGAHGRFDPVDQMQQRWAASKSPTSLVIMIKPALALLVLVIVLLS
jgi:hypothetical protein